MQLTQIRKKKSYKLSNHHTLIKDIKIIYDTTGSLLSLIKNNFLSNTRYSVTDGDKKVCIPSKKSGVQVFSYDFTIFSKLYAICKRGELYLYHTLQCKDDTWPSVIEQIICFFTAVRCLREFSFVSAQTYSKNTKHYKYGCI